MNNNYQELGQIKLVQLQPNGIIIETQSGYFYDASRRVEVESLLITPRGIEADTPAGEHVLDIHHLDHPNKAYDNDDLVCIGFTSHYQAMRNRFGDHMADGTAGENIVIEYGKEVWPEDLGQQIVIENQVKGTRALLDLISFAPPCEEFCRFAARQQYDPIPREKLKDTLEFLGNGRRGYLLVLNEKQEQVVVRPGDKVFVVGMR